MSMTVDHARSDLKQQAVSASKDGQAVSPASAQMSALLGRPGKLRRVRRALRP